jgi:phosphoglycerate dehydrogenase-like enzyme
MRRAVLNMRDERPVWAPPADFGDRIRARLGSGWELIEVAAPVNGRGDGAGLSDEALRAMRGAEIYLGMGMPRALLQAGVESGRLRWIHTGSAGVASLLHPELTQHDITLTNSAGIHAEPMAETVIAMMLHFTRGLDHAVRAQSRGDWHTAPWEQVGSGIRELTGATLGILGFGGIGRAVARRATALGMKVSALRRGSTKPGEDAADVQMLHGADALDTMLKQSDVIVITVPSTAETRGMIGARELALMRADAVLINVARGDIIDEDALADTLRAGRLRGAGLDVFAHEPLAPASPLWSLDRVLITPHVSATTTRYWERQGELILGNIDRYMAGQPLLNTVDVAAGY